MRLKAGDTAFIVESRYTVRRVQIVNCSGGLYLVRFEGGGGIRVRESRLFPTEEEARKSIPAREVPRRRIPYDYM